MPKDDRDPLQVLKFELEFLEKGGYGKSPRAPWRPQFFFEDSPTCMNYDLKDHPRPCGECLLLDHVPCQSRGEKFPCRHIPLDENGETLDRLYRYSTQEEAEEVLKIWLRAEIQKLEHDATEGTQKAGQ